MIYMGPEKLDQLLKDTQEEAVRSLARSTKLEDIYNLSGFRTEGMQHSMNDKFREFGVEITDVTITNVEIPEDIAARLENIAWFATREKHRITTFKYKTLVQSFFFSFLETTTRTRDFRKVN